MQMPWNKETDIIIHLKQFLKFTKQKYIDEISKIEIETKTLIYKIIKKKLNMRLKL